MKPSLAGKIWAHVFLERLGIFMPTSFLEKANKSSDDLTDILTDFSSVCPVAMTSLDRPFIESVQKHYNQLKSSDDERAKPVAVRPDDPILNLDGRVNIDGSPADVCCNPVVMSDLWNAVVVYIDEGVPADLARSVIGTVLDSKQKAFIIAPFMQRRPEDWSTVNISGCFDRPDLPRGKALTDTLPKIGSHFVCVTTWDNIEADSFPDGGTRYTHRNVLILPRGNSAKRVLPHLKTGYARVLVAGGISDDVMIDAVPPELRDDDRLADVYTLPHEWFADTLTRHINFDGTDQALGMLTFNDGMIKSTCRWSTWKNQERSGSIAVLGLETRKSPMLLLNVARTAWAVGADTVLLGFAVDPEERAGIEDFYGVLRDTGVRVLFEWLPPRSPFFRAGAFNMRAYNTMMTSPEFWQVVRDAVPHSHVVCAQDDGTFLRRVPDEVLQRWMQSDYIGAPWAPANLQHLKALVPDLVGNGGLSLRNVDAMLACTKHESMRAIRKTLFDNRFDMPEDVAFCHILPSLGFSVASNEIARKFAMEQVLEEDAFATHKPWLYHRRKTVVSMMDAANLEMGLVVTNVGGWESSLA